MLLTQSVSTLLCLRGGGSAVEVACFECPRFPTANAFCCPCLHPSIDGHIAQWITPRLFRAWRCIVCISSSGAMSGDIGVPFLGFVKSSNSLALGGEWNECSAQRDPWMHGSARVLGAAERVQTWLVVVSHSIYIALARRRWFEVRQ